jgi:hypothetical protein
MIFAFCTRQASRLETNLLGNKIADQFPDESCEMADLRIARYLIL